MLIVEEQKEMAVVIGKVWFAKLPWEKIGTVEKKKPISKNQTTVVSYWDLSCPEVEKQSTQNPHLALVSPVFWKKTSCAEDFADVNIDGTN